MYLLTTAQVAIRLNVTPNAVIQLIRRGTLHGKKLGRDWRFNPAAVDTLVQSRKTALGPADGVIEQVAVDVDIHKPSM